MMNDYIYSQLSKITTPYTVVDDTTIMFRRHYSISPTIGHFYIVKFADYIIHPYDGFDLHDNWNNGVAPPSQYMEIGIDNMFGKLMKIYGVAYDYDNRKELIDLKWDGYVPTKSIEFLEEVE